MYNYIFLIGKLKAFTTDSITLEVKEPFKNTNNEVMSHDFKIYMPEYILDAMPIDVYNQIVAVKGRITKENDHLKLIGERVTYMEEQYGK
jgi:hypothetical protein